MTETKENIPSVKPWDGCKHSLTRKLYFQRANKWVTTEYSICEKCGYIIKKTRIENE